MSKFIVTIQARVENLGRVTIESPTDASYTNGLPDCASIVDVFKGRTKISKATTFGIMAAGSSIFGIDSSITVPPLHGNFGLLTRTSELFTN